MTTNVEFRCSPRTGYEEVFVSATAGEAGAADEVFATIAEGLAARRATPLCERVYGARSARDRLLAARARHFGRHDLEVASPVGFIDGSPPGGGDFAGVQVRAVSAARGHAITTVDGGRLWSGPTFRVLHLVDVHGRAGDCISEQAAQMFANADTLARANDFDFARTARTWIYLARLLDWYGEFNRVRSEAYARYEFAPPASTGIQGRSGDTECTMDALLIEGLECRPIDHTARQGSACGYGSRFSRGVEITHAGGRTVHVSGTASIDGIGRSLHPDDPAAQSAEMLLCIGAVLAESGMSLADIQEATLFCKDERALAACQQVRGLLGIPAFPTVAVRADVCRPELLVEMEAVACR